MIIAPGIEYPPQGHQGHHTLPQPLLLAPPEVSQRQGGRFLLPGQQHRVAPEHHCLVSDLVPVDPAEEPGVGAVCAAVGDSVHSTVRRFLPNIVPRHCPEILGRRSGQDRRKEGRRLG
uniref:Uncharacterized protein n=1 Tax=Xenopus tropicalis TaxID=8364 RepID=A0A6I8SNM8_XENTR